jgi:ABC-type transport system substrate-binding protein
MKSVMPGDRHQFAYMQQHEPASLYCPDETDVDALRVCAQISEGLYRTNADGATPIPALADGCTADEELTTWTCTLRSGVRFHDGTHLDANDVVLSFAVQWDTEHPLHRGREGRFTAFIERFGGLLHPPPDA